MAHMRTQEASFSSSGWTYQVFLSFRGVDTRKTFTSHLYTALVQAGFHTFRDDDEIERGNNIKPELEKAIQQSRISIIVFSNNYASSRWCLDELLMILERKRTSKHVVLPVFYHVDPSQVRYQSGSIGEAFDRYEEKLKTETNDERKKEFTDKVRRWKEALREVADLSGMELKDQDNGWIDAIKGLCCSYFSWLTMVNNLRSSYNVEFKTEAFTRMQQIKFLQLNFVKLTGGYKNFPNGLRWLCWHGFHSNFMPNDFPLDSLIGLDLQYSSLKRVWKRSKFLPCLKTLNLSHSEWLEGTPKFSEVPNLEILILKGCVRLVEVCESIEFAERLLVLDLENCKKLTKLPRKLDMIRKLERLIISGCSSLCEFPMGLRNLDSLKEFRADGINMNLIVGLARVVQQGASFPRSLSKLSLVGCNLSNDSFPKDFSNLSSLMCLNLSNNLIETLPNCIRSLCRLEDLFLNNCPRLQSIVGLPSTVRNISAAANRSLKKVETTPNSVSTFAFGCRELIEVERLFKSVPVTNCDIKILKKLGLFDVDLMITSKYTMEFYNAIKVEYEYGIFSTSVPGCVPPAGYYCVSTPPHISNSVTFTVPSLPNIRGLNVCVIYRGWWSYYRCPVIKMHNETKDFSWLYCPNFRMPDSQEEYFMMLSHWKSGNAIKSGDRVTVSVDTFNGDDEDEQGVVVKKIGIKVVYDDEDEEDEENRTMSCKSSSYLSWAEQNTLVKLSDFHVTGTDYYFASPNRTSDALYKYRIKVMSLARDYYVHLPNKGAYALNREESGVVQRNRVWVPWNAVAKPDSGGSGVKIFTKL